MNTVRPSPSPRIDAAKVHIASTLCSNEMGGWRRACFCFFLFLKTLLTFNLQLMPGTYADSQVAQDTYRDDVWLRGLASRDPQSIAKYWMPVRMCVWVGVGGWMSLWRAHE